MKIASAYMFSRGKERRTTEAEEHVHVTSYFCRFRTRMTKERKGSMKNNKKFKTGGRLKALLPFLI